jgi:hypothetical protein
MKTKNTLSIDVYINPKSKLEYIDIPITITPLPKIFTRVETIKKILKLINEKI